MKCLIIIDRRCNAGELESLLYCLLFWACEGQLHWRHGMGVAAMAALKYDAMHRLFEVSHTVIDPG